MANLNKKELLKLVPERLSMEMDEVANALSKYIEGDQECFDTPSLSDLGRILACSPFVQAQAKCFPGVIAQGLKNGISSDSRAIDDQLEIFTRDTLLLAEEADVMRALRGFRNQHMLQIAWRDLAGGEVCDILQQLSALADGLIQCAVAWSHQAACKRWGVPRDDQGREQKLMVIAMGKLGARELNFSSDIDLIFCYQSTGETDGARSLSNEEFFTRSCRTLVQLLDKKTQDGFVFRVDIRLRPFGNSGALVLNGDGMEHYYQSHAREWERYAMVKARLITGEEADKASIQSMLSAFVYRRYLDYGIFDSIRVMKRQIEAQLQQKGIQNNVKLGPGGIREIEFIGQAFQLIRGGRDKSLQARGILPILSLLAEKGHIPTKAAEELAEDYRYLRRLENSIQEIEDRQTHELPQDEINQMRLVLAMRADNWNALLEQTQQVMTRVHAYFASLIDFSTKDPEANESNWLDMDEASLSHYLQSQNASVSEGATRDIVEFFHSYPVRQLQEKGREYLKRLMPMLIDALLLTESQEQTLLNFLTMLEKICNRTAYLVLLVENKLVFEQLIRLAKLSPWIITQVTRSPILLDELIDPASLYGVVSKTALAAELDIAIAEVNENDVEGQMEALRLFKQVNVLRVAAADLTGVMALMVVSDKLTEIAEVIVEKTLALSWQSVCAAYGTPSGADARIVSGFGVVGFGKLGGIELGFSSDLDLVFIHQDAPADEMTVGDKSVSLGEFYTRLGRKIISLLTTRTFSGPLYEIDLRLRPNGKSGLLVTSESAFASYQKTQAWTWEHQALIRARFIAGCDQIGGAFNRIRAEVLSKEREIDTLKKDIIDMREKMRVALLKSQAGCFDLKHGHGGIVDIEFIVQFGVLAKACRYEALLTYTDNIRLLLELNNIGFLSDSQQQQLSETYKTYREASHHAALAEKPTMIDNSFLDLHIKRVGSIWNEIFK